MRFRPLASEPLPGAIAAVSAVLAGLILFFSRPGDVLARFSFDVPSLFRGRLEDHSVIVVKMDEQTYTDLGQEYPRFDRALHAEFLRKLKESGAKLVVFDVFFADTNASDLQFASAINDHGRVVIGVELEPNAHPLFPGGRQIDPAETLRDLPGCRYGLLGLRRDIDLVVRRFPPANPSTPFLAQVAAEALLERKLRSDPHTRWINYYRTNEIEEISYKFARTAGPAYFQEKIVFIGGKPRTLHVGDKADEFATPLTRWHGVPMAGVEVHATMFLNLLRNETLRRAPPWVEIFLVLFAGAVGGFFFARFRPVAGLFALLLGSAIVTLAGIVLFLLMERWFNWALIAGVQLPIGWAASALVFSRNVLRERNALKEQVETALRDHSYPGQRGLELKTPPSSSGEASGESLACDLVLRDFELLKRIGEGSYGEVWLARSLTGAYRAIKVIYRRNFPEERPFQREFEGVRNFEPISGKHPGWVSILHVGKDDASGCFYYVMHPADDLRFGPAIDPNVYVPKTLGKMLVEHQCLPLKEAVAIGVQLADALAALHARDLVHRDVKTSNIIFVNSIPQLADIGLVIRGNETMSYSGTEYYLPPEGPGLAGDIYALGKVLYQAATGCQVSEYPGLPASINERKDARDLLKLLDIVNKACQPAVAKRYATAAALRDDLHKLESALNRRWR